MPGNQKDFRAKWTTMYHTIEVHLNSTPYMRLTNGEVATWIVVREAQHLQVRASSLRLRQGGVGKPL